MCWLFVTIGYLWSSFFFNHTATTEIYTLALHDALPIFFIRRPTPDQRRFLANLLNTGFYMRSEEHTSELQSHSDLVCRLLLEKKKIHPLPKVRPPSTLPHRPRPPSRSSDPTSTHSPSST